jgi:hypothetical protein
MTRTILNSFIAIISLITHQLSIAKINKHDAQKIYNIIKQDYSENVLLLNLINSRQASNLVANLFDSKQITTTQTLELTNKDKLQEKKDEDEDLKIWARVFTSDATYEGVSRENIANNQMHNMGIIIGGEVMKKPNSNVSASYSFLASSSEANAKDSVDNVTQNNYSNFLVAAASKKIEHQLHSLALYGKYDFMNDLHLYGYLAGQTTVSRLRLQLIEKQPNKYIKEANKIKPQTSFLAANFKLEKEWNLDFLRSTLLTNIGFEYDYLKQKPIKYFSVYKNDYVLYNAFLGIIGAGFNFDLMHAKQFKLEGNIYCNYYHDFKSINKNNDELLNDEYLIDVIYPGKNFTSFGAYLSLSKDSYFKSEIGLELQSGKNFSAQSIFASIKVDM